MKSLPWECSKAW